MGCIYINPASFVRKIFKLLIIKKLLFSSCIALKYAVVSEIIYLYNSNINCLCALVTFKTMQHIHAM